MPNAIVVRPLRPPDVEDYQKIRVAALKSNPEAFGSVHAVEAVKPVEKHAERLTSSLTLGAYDGRSIVGMIGLRREDGLKDAHKGVVWGFYVESGSRTHGVGTALLSAILTAAPGLVEQVMLSVVERNTAAIALYEKFGFVRYGVEPRALKTGTGYLNEVLMVLFLDRKPEPIAGQATTPR